MYNLLFIGFVLIFFYLFQKNKINILEYVLLLFSVEQFNLSLGQVYTPLNITLILLPIIYVFRYKDLRIDRKSLKVFLAVIIFIMLHLIVVNVAISYLNIESFRFYSIFGSLKNAIIFIIKTVVPVLFLYNVILRERRNNIFSLYSILNTIFYYSTAFALIQILFNIAGLQEYIHLVGAKREISFKLAGFEYVRIGALFSEPKMFATYLGIMNFVYYRKREIKKLAACIVLGLLTMSNTYLFILVLFGVIVIFKKTQFKRRIALAVFLIFFMLKLTPHMLGFLTQFDNNPVNQFLFERIERRFDATNSLSAQVMLGIPFQADLEGPIVNYFNENPFLNLTGYGAKNGYILPAKYYEGTYIYDDKIMGTYEPHMNMGWFFIFAQFGIIGLIISIYWFAKFYKNNAYKNILLYMSIIFFVARIELLLILILFYGRRNIFAFKK